MKKAAIGIDIGGTNTVIGIVDKNADILYGSSFPTNKYSEIDDYVNCLTGHIKQGIEFLKDIDIQGIGVGAPNGNYINGTIEEAPNLRWKGVLPMVDLLQKKTGIKTFLTNDANAAALGEMVYGGAKNMKNFIVVTLGTGLGSGIVVDGKLVYGHDGFAGELGHTIVDYNGRQCNCGRRGCLETYVSATGIKRTVAELLANSTKDSVLRKISFDKLDSKQIYDAAKQADEIALEAFDYTARILGQKLADSVAYLSPEAIFLFGGLANAEEFIFEPVKKYMEEHLLNIFKNKVDILPSLLKDKNIAVLGAAALVWAETK